MNNYDIDSNDFGDHGFPNGLNPFVKILNYREISKFVALIIKNWNFVTPNKITILGLVFTILSMALISLNNINASIWGVIIGIVSIFFDYLDGSLARIRSVASIFGQKLDALQDHLIILLLPLSLIVSLRESYFFNQYVIVLIIIYFNIYFYALGSKELTIYQHFMGKKKEDLNHLQQFILEKTKINLGIHTIFQADSLLVVYWITAIWGYQEIALIQFLLCICIRNFELFSVYYRQIRFK